MKTPHCPQNITQGNLLPSQLKKNPNLSPKLLSTPFIYLFLLSMGREEPLEKEMTTHSSILAWRIPWTEEPGGLQPTGSQIVGT